MTPLETYEHEGVTVQIHYDQDATSPREWDNLSVMVSTDSRYGTLDREATRDETEADSRRDGLLERYLRLTEDVVAFSDTRFGFAYVTRERCEQLGAPIESAQDQLQGEIDEYNAWGDGEAYGYIVDKDGPDEESCWGYIGDIDYCKSEANAVAEYVAKARRAPDRIYVDGVPIEEALYALSTAGGTGRGTA